MQPNLTLLVKHQYDALNRLVASTPSAQAASQRFYMNDRLVTEIQGAEQRSIMQHDDQLLAQQQRQSGNIETRLLATDPQRSVLNVLDATRPHPLAYTPYGHRPLGNGLLSLLGFTGQWSDSVTGWYLLGTGYHRPFNPVLMCFTSPDSWSPFGKGGVNAYAYCVRDPVNRADPSGHIGKFWTIIKNSIFKTEKKNYSLLLSPPAMSPINKIVNTESTSALGLFEKLQGMPDINEQIIRALPGKDMVSLASTSKNMKRAVYEFATPVSALRGPAATHENLTQAALGNTEGVLPRDAIFAQSFQKVMAQIKVRKMAQLIRENNAANPLPNGRRGAFSIQR